MRGLNKQTNKQTLKKTHVEKSIHIIGKPMSIFVFGDQKLFLVSYGKYVTLSIYDD